MNKHLKIGFVSEQIEKPVMSALAQVATTLFGYKVDEIRYQDFKPQHVQERGIDALVLEGRNESDEKYALEIRKQVQKPVLYFALGSTKNDLAKHGIEVYQQAGAIEMLVRLDELPRRTI